MTSIAEEVAVLEQQQGWDRLFRKIKTTSAQYDLSCKVAKLQENRNKNRYRDVSPYDHSRVKLIDGPSDYINSSLVEVKPAGRRYILSQGPLPATSGQLWQMVWEQNSKAVIMLNKIIEKGTRKCDQYWPINQNSPMTFNEGFQLSLISQNDNKNFIIRELELTNLKDDCKRSIFQFHYTAWPDFGVPESPTAFLDFLASVRQHDVLENKYGPAVIHCSAGIGRSGTFVLVDTCLVFLENEIEFDIEETLLEMRRYRMGLIQTPSQLRFSYFAIAECERILQNRQDDDSSIAYSSGESEEDEIMNPESNGDYIRNPNSTEQKDESNDNATLPGELNGPFVEKSTEKLTRASNDVPKITEDSLATNISQTKHPTEPDTVTVHPENSVDKSSIESNLRKRRLEERKAFQTRIETVKNKMKESEKRWPWKNYVIGGLAAAVVLALAFRHWYNG